MMFRRQRGNRSIQDSNGDSILYSSTVSNKSDVSSRSDEDDDLQPLKPIRRMNGMLIVDYSVFDEGDNQEFPVQRKRPSFHREDTLPRGNGRQKSFEPMQPEKLRSCLRRQDSAGPRPPMSPPSHKQELQI